MELHLKIIGAILILLALIHSFFPSYFKWKEELQRLSLVNRQIMQVHTFFLAFMLLLMGILCLTYSAELVQAPLGKPLTLGFGIFWGFRLIAQLFVYSKKLWQGKAFETSIHILFIGLWTYFTAVFLSINFNMV